MQVTRMGGEVPVPTEPFHDSEFFFVLGTSESAGSMIIYILGIMYTHIYTHTLGIIYMLVIIYIHMCVYMYVCIYIGDNIY